MKLKSLILTIGLSLFALCGLLAQEKYEYALVHVAGFSEKNGKIFVSKGNSFEEIDFTVAKGHASRNRSAFIAMIEKMENEGWEVFAVGEDNTYHLRKKKN